MSIKHTNLLDQEAKPIGYYTWGRREMLDFIPTSAKKILDVGCGEGIFGSVIKTERDAEVWGIEICEKAVLNATKRLDKVIISDFENNKTQQLLKGYFDCIVFNDVLEHFKNPWDVLKNASRYLCYNGIIVASIPNVRYFENLKNIVFHKKWEYTEAGIMDKTHLRFFTVKSIEDIFQACGYTIVRLEGIHSKRFPWKFRLFNWLLFNALDDTRFRQFACVAQKVNKI